MVRGPVSQAYHTIFERHRPRASSDISSNKLMDRLFAPDVEGYLADQAAGRAALERLSFERLELEADDGISLVAYEHREPGATRTLVVVHGHGSCGFEGAAFVGPHFARAGYNLLLPDSRACGESEGRITTFGIQERRDVLRWLELAHRRHPEDRFFVHGVSSGGATVCMLAGLDLPADVRALSEESGFAELEPELRYVVRTIAHVPARPVVALLGRRFQRETTFTLQDACGLRAVAHASRPMLFIHGQEDVYVRPRAAVELYRACSSPASLLLIPGAGHCAAARTAPEEFFSHLDDFYDCYA